MKQMTTESITEFLDELPFRESFSILLEDGQGFADLCMVAKCKNEPRKVFLDDGFWLELINESWFFSGVGRKRIRIKRIGCRNKRYNR